jgi:hypothetical protein
MINHKMARVTRKDAKGERDTTIYRTRSPKLNAQRNENNLLKYEVDTVFLYRHFAGR